VCIRLCDVNRENIMRRKQVSASALASTSQLEETNLFIGEFDHETCRLCSVKSNGSFGIFSAKGVKKNLPALVKNYLNLEVRPVYPIHSFY
jgi:hypothetical protein